MELNYEEQKTLFLLLKSSISEKEENLLHWEQRVEEDPAKTCEFLVKKLNVELEVLNSILKKLNF